MSFAWISKKTESLPVPVTSLDYTQREIILSMKNYLPNEAEDSFGGSVLRTFSGEKIVLSPEVEGALFGNVDRILIVVPDDNENPSVTSAEDLPDHLSVSGLLGFIFSESACQAVSMFPSPLDEASH